MALARQSGSAGPCLQCSAHCRFTLNLKKEASFELDSDTSDLRNFIGRSNSCERARAIGLQGRRSARVPGNLHTSPLRGHQILVPSWQAW